MEDAFSIISKVLYNSKSLCRDSRLQEMQCRDRKSVQIEGWCEAALRSHVDAFLLFAGDAILKMLWTVDFC